MKQFTLHEAAAVAPKPGMELDAGGVWRDVILVDTNGKVTTDPALAVCKTLIEPHDEKALWNAATGEWVVPLPTITHDRNHCNLEYQYVNGQLVKVNYLLYGATLAVDGQYQLALVRKIYTGPMAAFSITDEKYMVWGILKEFLRALNEAGITIEVPERFSGLASLSLFNDGRIQIKAYDTDAHSYSLPSLPGTAAIYLGVATVFDRDSGERPVREVFFKAEAQDVQQWATKNGLMMSGRDDVDYYGVDFNADGSLVGNIKELVQVDSSTLPSVDGVPDYVRNIVQAVEEETQAHNWGDLLAHLAVTPPPAKNLLRNKSICLLPWGHLLTDTVGDTYPCCVWNGTIEHNIRNETLEQIANSPQMNAIRLKMLAGEDVKGCESCYKIERGGAPHGSMRYRYARALNGLEEDLSSATNIDGSLKAPFEMKFMGSQYSNLCNYSCRSCDSKNSSRIATENKDVIPIKMTKDIRPSYFDEVLGQVKNVRMVSMIGGESVLIPEHWKLMDEMIAQGKNEDGNVHVTIITNMSKLEYQGKSLIDYAKKFKTFRVLCSVDAIGQRAELYRDGTRWDEVESNIRALISAGIAPNYSVTVGATNVHHIPDMHMYLIEHGLLAPSSNILLNLLVFPEILNVKVLPLEFKREVAAKITGHIAALKTMPLFDEARQIQEGLQIWDELVNFMLSEDRTDLLPQFIEYHRALDRERGQDTFAVFPELASFIKGGST